MRGVLIGNYGVDNLGDEALKDFFLQAFPAIEWTVVSANPSHDREVQRLPGGFRSLLMTPWWRTVKAIRESDAVVFGGGSLFTDVESVYACLLWGLHAAASFWLGKPVFLAFQGMGPYKTRLGEGIARWVARRARYVSVRDDASVKRVEQWGLSRKVIQTFDPIFSLMVRQKVDIQAKNVFTIIPRHNSSELLVQEAKNIVSNHISFHTVQILLMQPQSSEEQAVAEALRRVLGEGAVVVPVMTLNELMKAVSTSSLVLTQRFHGALAALAAGVPVQIIAQGQGDKLSELKQFEGTAPDLTPLRSLVENGESTLREALRNL